MQNRGRPILAMHGNRLARSLLGERAALCRSLLEAFGRGARPVLQEGRLHWSDMTLEDGTIVQLGTQTNLHVRAMAPTREIASIRVVDLRPDAPAMHPENVEALTAVLTDALACIEAGLEGNAARAIKTMESDLVLVASREALARRLVADRIGLAMPSPFAAGTAVLSSNYTKGCDPLAATVSAMADLPWTVQISQDHQGGITIEPAPYRTAKRRWTAAHRAGPLAMAA